MDGSDILGICSPPSQVAVGGRKVPTRRRELGPVEAVVGCNCAGRPREHRPRVSAPTPLPTHSTPSAPSGRERRRWSFRRPKAATSKAADAGHGQGPLASSSSLCFSESAAQIESAARRNFLVDAVLSPQRCCPGGSATPSFSLHSAAILAAALRRCPGYRAGR